MMKALEIVKNALLTILAIAIAIALIPNGMSMAQTNEAWVSIYCENTEDIFFGDTVVLQAEMDKEAEGCCWIWEAGNNDHWTVVQEGGLSYRFIADQNNANLEYRVVVLGA